MCHVSIVSFALLLRALVGNTGDTQTDRRSMQLTLPRSIAPVSRALPSRLAHERVSSNGQQMLARMAPNSVCARLQATEFARGAFLPPIVWPVCEAIAILLAHQGRAPSLLPARLLHLHLLLQLSCQHRSTAPVFTSSLPTRLCAPTRKAPPFNARVLRPASCVHRPIVHQSLDDDGGGRCQGT